MNIYVCSGKRTLCNGVLFVKANRRKYEIDYRKRDGGKVEYI